MVNCQVWNIGECGTTLAIMARLNILSRVAIAVGELLRNDSDAGAV